MCCTLKSLIAKNIPLLLFEEGGFSHLRSLIILIYRIAYIMSLCFLSIAGGKRTLPVDLKKSIEIAATEPDSKLEITEVTLSP